MYVEKTPNAPPLWSVPIILVADRVLNVGRLQATSKTAASLPHGKSAFGFLEERDR
jgi:hypothetical protein